MKTFLLFLAPLVLLAAVIVLFLATDGAGLDAEPAVPIEALSFERTILKPVSIEFRVRNTGPADLTLAQAVVRDMVVKFSVSPSATLRRMETAVVTIPYPWIEGEAYEISLFSANSVPFAAAIEAAAETKEGGPAAFLGFTLIGLYVGLIPVFLGILWLPALRRLGRTAFTALMAVTVGLLIFLGIDTIAEALEGSAELVGPLQGPGLIGIGAVGAFLILDAVSRRQTKLGADEEGRRRRVATLISLGIGLHNLAEGLAIGSAFSLGAANLGKFFVIGFILQNITEGLGIIAPIVKQKPPFRYLAFLGVLGGGPAILGAWIGGLGISPAFSVFSLALGTGAVLEVAYEIGKLIGKRMDEKPFVVSGGVLAGMGILYATGLLIK